MSLGEPQGAMCNFVRDSFRGPAEALRAAVALSSCTMGLTLATVDGTVRLVPYLLGSESACTPIANWLRLLMSEPADRDGHRKSMHRRISESGPSLYAQARLPSDHAGVTTRIPCDRKRPSHTRIPWASSKAGWMT